MAERLIRLSVTDAPKTGGRVLMYSLAVDGEVIAANEELTLEQSEQIREIHETYETLFVNRKPKSADLAVRQLQTIGALLFDLWLSPRWRNIAAIPGGRRILLVASTLPEVLNLPWELLRPPDGSPIGTDAGWGVRRFPWLDETPGPGAALLPGPLRVLFFACSPRDLPELDFEREEEILTTALGSNVVMETALLGTFEELGDLTDRFKPHILHLSGHGVVGQQGASFCFEDDKGFKDPKSAAIIGQRFSGSGVRCVFVSGCDAGTAPPRNALGGVCQSIIANGIPMAIGWAAPIVDEIATTVAKKFYGAVAGGAPADYALARARWEGNNKYGTTGDPSWSLPVLYVATADTLILDREGRERPPPSREHLPLRGMSKGCARHLVGRRRELQAVVPGLRDGSIRGSVLTGLGGVGKSSVGTRIARKLEALHDMQLQPIVISCSSGIPLNPDHVFDACRTVFLRTNRQGAAARTKDRSVEVRDRLNVLIEDLSDGYVVVLDDFQISVDEATRRVFPPEIAEFYRNLLTNLLGSSRVLVTSRYLPADLDPLPDDIVELTLGELSETAYFKFMFRDARVQRRYQASVAEREVLSRLYDRFGAAPRLLAAIRDALIDNDMDPAVLSDQMTQHAYKLDRPFDIPLDTVHQTHAGFCSDIRVDRLYNRLSEHNRNLLARLAAYPDPLALADAEALTGRPEKELLELMTACRQSALAHPAGGVADAGFAANWSTYGSLRHWLTGPPRLSVDERQNVYRGAGDYLRKQFEQLQKDGLPISHLRQLLQARSLYLAAGAAEPAREATSRISSILVQLGEYAQIERLNAELLKEAELSGRDQHPEPTIWIARVYFEQDEFAAARDWYRKALTLSRDQHPREKAHAIAGLATICIREGHYDDARKQIEDSLKILTMDDRKDQGEIWYQLALIDFYEGNYDDARTKLKTVLDLLGNESPEFEQASWHQLGSIDLEQNIWDEATNAFNKAREMARAMGNRKAEADAIHQLGRARFRGGARQDGLDLLKSALAMRRALNDRAGEALSFRRLAEVASDAGELGLALRLAMIGLGINRAIRASTTRDGEAIEQWTSALGYPPRQIEEMQAEVDTQYLTDRGKTLLKRLRARP